MDAILIRHVGALKGAAQRHVGARACCGFKGLRKATFGSQHVNRACVHSSRHRPHPPG